MSSSPVSTFPVHCRYHAKRGCFQIKRTARLFYQRARIFKAHYGVVVLGADATRSRQRARSPAFEAREAARQSLLEH
jgi:ribosomal protein L15E